MFSHVIEMHTFSRDADLSLIILCCSEIFPLQAQFTINKPLCFYKTRSTYTGKALWFMTLHSLSSCFQAFRQHALALCGMTVAIPSARVPVENQGFSEIAH